MIINQIDNNEKYLEIANHLEEENYNKTKNESLNPEIYRKDKKEVCFYIEEQNKLIAGITGEINFYSWLHIDLLWVDKEYRNKNFGTKLIDKMKTFAKENGCIGIRLETWDFQAKGFYEKMGFKEFGKLENCPKGITRFYMCYYL